MNLVADVKNTVKEAASKKTISQVIAYSVAFVIALAAVGLAISFRDKETDRFGFASYGIALISPALVKVLFKWAQGKGVRGSFISGGLNYQLGAAVGVAVILMYFFDETLKPLLTAEAARTPAGKEGPLTAIMFAIPKMINKERAEAGKAYALSGAMNVPKLAGQVAPGTNSADSGSTDLGTAGADAPKSGQAGVGEDIQRLIDQAFADVGAPTTAGPGVGGATDMIFLDLVK